jgi:hypothetical protein
LEDGAHRESVVQVIRMNTSNDLQKQPSGMQIQAPEKGFSIKRLTFILLAMCLFSLLAHGGSETYCGKQAQQVASLPRPQWYADNGVAPHIGWASDFSWKFAEFNVRALDRPRNNCGMVRTGVNFAF